MKKSQHLHDTSSFSDVKVSEKNHTQLAMVKKAFEPRPATMWEVSIKTGITRPNICRHVAELRKTKRIAMLHKGICPISNYRAGFYTTDKNLFPLVSRVYTLFDGGPHENN